jgi:hypothetical protein
LENICKLQHSGIAPLLSTTGAHLQAKIPFVLLLSFVQMRDTVQQVAHLFPTAIISGRGRDKVEGFVQLPELFYAGSHGMDIAGPKVCSALQQQWH